jgi:hypothetical protein
MSITNPDVRFSSNAMKKYRNNSVVHKVTKLVKKNISEESFADVVTDIAVIVPFDHSVAEDAHINFLNVAKTASPSVVANLRVWYQLYHNS